MAVHQDSEAARAFEIWYECDRDWSKTARSMEVSPGTLHYWAQLHDWHRRADYRDREIFQQNERAAIKRKLELLDKQRQIAQRLQFRGLEYLAEKKITRAADALKAISLGVEMERQAEGFPQMMVQVRGMSDDELQAEYERTLRVLALPPGDSGSGDGAAPVDEGAGGPEEPS